MRWFKTSLHSRVIFGIKALYSSLSLFAGLVAGERRGLMDVFESGLEEFVVAVGKWKVSVSTAWSEYFENQQKRGNVLGDLISSTSVLKEKLVNDVLNVAVPNGRGVLKFVENARIAHPVRSTRDTVRCLECRSPNMGKQVTRQELK
jgi:hypothetical protein